MSLLGSTILFIGGDLFYRIVRRSEKFPRYGRRGRLVEAALVTALVMAWGWLVAPALFDPDYLGLIGILIFGLLLVPANAGLWLLGRIDRPLLLPLGVSGLLFFFTLLVLAAVAELILGNPASTMGETLAIPFVVGNVLSIFGGTYGVITWLDRERTVMEDERERARVLSGPYSPSTTPRTDTTGDPGTNTHEATDTVVVEDVPTTRDPDIRSPTASNPTEAPLQNLTYDWQYSPQRFIDIGGYDDVKANLGRRVLEPLLAKRDGNDRFSRFGIEPESGIMLYGPPGTGKTLFARALAGELTVPFVELSPADVTSMWINESSDRVKVLFDEATQLGQCVIFLDEAEHVFGAREYSGKGSHAEDRKVTSEFLAQLTREGREAIVVAATNRPGDIDPAILRPGRLAAHFGIGPPDELARVAILRTHLSDVPTSISDDEYAILANHTAGMTGADLADLVAGARRNAADRDARALTRDDFPSTEDLRVLATEVESELQVLPVEDPENGSERPRDPEIAVGSTADDATGGDGSPIGFQ